MSNAPVWDGLRCEEGGEAALGVPQLAVDLPVRVEVAAHDLAAVVETEQLGVGERRGVDHGRCGGNDEIGTGPNKPGFVRASATWI
jgi:hypothetical protein